MSLHIDCLLSVFRNGLRALKSRELGKFRIFRVRSDGILYASMASGTGGF
jgi:hypothetical protein